MGPAIKADIAHLATWLIYVVDVLFARRAQHQPLHQHLHQPLHQPLHQHHHPQVNVEAGVRVITMGATIKADIAHLATWLIYVVDVLFAGSLEDNLERAGWHKAYQARGNPGYVGLDKIFCTEHWRSFNGKDRGTGRSDHPAISVDLTLKAD